MAASRLRATLRMTHLLGLAARNVMRNTARSILSLAAIAAGVAGLMLSGGFVNDLVFQLGEVRLVVNSSTYSREGDDDHALEDGHEMEMLAPSRAMFRPGPAEPHAFI